MSLLFEKVVIGGKITKNICHEVQKRPFTDFFSLKTSFFLHFCLIFQLFTLYLRRISMK